jgi:hypothetical protein
MEVYEIVDTAVIIVSTIFWDITPSSELKVNRHFGGIDPSLLMVESQTRYQQEIRWQAE